MIYVRAVLGGAMVAAFLLTATCLLGWWLAGL